MILENVRDKKLMQLYETLTRSDFEGSIQDEYVICLLYTIRCLDSLQKTDRFIKKKDMMNIAKEIFRIYETSEKDYEDISIMAYTKGLFNYMKSEGLEYKDIHSMNTYDLLNNVKEYLSNLY